MYDISYAESVAKDLRNFRANDRRTILNAIESQLAHEPNRPTRNRKVLVGLVPPWEHVEPVWELRVGEYRVFYDVDEAESTVVIRAIRHKPAHRTMEDIL
jgi:mRNA-degrading endonuclease RelE of RelBE toxin-antitoxin system